MGQVVWAWGNVTELAVDKLFDGSEESIQVLTGLMSNGKLISGSQNGNPIPKVNKNSVLQASVVRTFYAYTIPALWSTAAMGVFVMDSGHSCDDTDAVTPRYLSEDTARATSACYNKKLYYLVHTGGDAQTCEQGQCGDVGCVPTWYCTDNQFSKPPGLDQLGSAQYGYITVRDLIVGYVLIPSTLHSVESVLQVPVTHCGANGTLRHMTES